MRKTLSLLLLTLVVVACGSEGSTFKIDGHLMNLNQGEFYVYSPDGVIDGIDTIFVVAGRFNYKTSCDHDGTLVIVFPNFSEQPIFAQPGKSVTVSGDASHLRELKVKGTKENRLMNTFREKTRDTASDQLPTVAHDFILAHTESLAAIYLVDRYFIYTPSPDYAAAADLLDTLCMAQPNNGRLAINTKKIRALADTNIGQPLPPFTAVTIDGDTITQRDLSNGDAVIYLWASYDFESCNIQRTIRDKAADKHLLGLSLDPTLHDCQRIIKRDNIVNPTVCCTTLFDDTLLAQLALTTLPDNIILHNGRITARTLTRQQLLQLFTPTTTP